MIKQKWETLLNAASALKEQILSLSKGGIMDGVEETKAAEAKAALEAEASKKVIEAEAAKKIKDEEDLKAKAALEAEAAKKVADEAAATLAAAEAAKKPKEGSKEEEAKETKEQEDKESKEKEAQEEKDKAEAAKKAKDVEDEKEKAEAAKKKKDEEDVKEKAEAAKKEKEAWASAMNHKPPKEALAEYSEAEKALAEKCSYADLLKMACSLSAKMDEMDKEAKAAKAAQTAEARFLELASVGLVATAAEKVVSQKKRLGSMSDAAFASYKEELLEVRGAGDSATLKEDLQAAKNAVDNLSVAANIEVVDLKKQYEAIG